MDTKSFTDAVNAKLTAADDLIKVIDAQVYFSGLLNNACNDLLRVDRLPFTSVADCNHRIAIYGRCIDRMEERYKKILQRLSQAAPQRLPKYKAESSFDHEDILREYPHCTVVVGDFGDDIGTQTVANSTNLDIAEVQALIDVIVDGNPL